MSGDNDSLPVAYGATSRVITSPTGLVFDTEDAGGETVNNLLKTAGSVAETLVKTKLK